MLDINDSITLIKIYRLLEKKCEAIDEFIKNHAFSFSGYTEEFGTASVCKNIIDLMARKNQLINLKIILDSAVNKLDEKDKKIMFVKMHYSLSIEELGGLLELTHRSVYRRIERAFANLTEYLNNSKYSEKLLDIIESEIWVRNIRNDIRTKHPLYKTATCGV